MSAEVLCVWVGVSARQVDQHVLSPALAEECCCANTGPWELAGLGQNTGGVVDEI